MTPKDGRIKLLAVPSHVLADIFRAGCLIGLTGVRVGNGLPPDAEIDRIGYDMTTDCFMIRVWSASYPVVPDGIVPPYETVMFFEERPIEITT